MDLGWNTIQIVVLVTNLHFLLNPEHRCNSATFDHLTDSSQYVHLALNTVPLNDKFSNKLAHASRHIHFCKNQS